MAEQGMRLSLLYALIDPELYHPISTSKTSEEANTEQTQRDKDYERKGKLDNRQLPAKKKAREALYQALYAIVEYPNVNRALNRAIAKALCNAMREDETNLRDDPDVTRLYEILQPIIRDAIDES
jgi:hypothetical protein